MLQAEALGFVPKCHVHARMRKHTCTGSDSAGALPQPILSTWRGWRALVPDPALLPGANPPQGKPHPPNPPNLRLWFAVLLLPKGSVGPPAARVGSSVEIVAAQACAPLLSQRVEVHIRTSAPIHNTVLPSRCPDTRLDKPSAIDRMGGALALVVSLQLRGTFGTHCAAILSFLRIFEGGLALPVQLATIVNYRSWMRLRLKCISCSVAQGLIAE